MHGNLGGPCRLEHYRLAEDYFTYDSLFGQSSGGTYTPYPVGFAQISSNLYGVTLETLSTTHRSRRHLIGTGASNLKTAESTPDLDPDHANCMNTSGLVVGYSSTPTIPSVPVFWSASTLTSDTNATVITPGTYSYGEALMVNAVGWAVGYFGNSLAVSATQEVFFNKTSTNTTTILDVPSGYVDARAMCINGKTNTPEYYRIGGWKRTSTGYPKPILWKLVDDEWEVETIYDPDGVFTGRIAYIADINDNGVCVGRLDGPDPSYYEEVEEPGGLFIYTPGDKVRRISLNGLTSAIPVRINNNNEIAVNRSDGGTLQPYLVFPPQLSGSVRGSVISWGALWSPNATVESKAVYEFKDDRRFCGYGELATVGNPRIAYLAKIDTGFTNVTPSSHGLDGLTQVYGGNSSLGVLDGDYLQLSLTSSPYTMIVYGTKSGSMNSYKFNSQIRAMTGGLYEVKISYFNWPNNRFDAQGDFQSISTDFKPFVGTDVNNSDYFYHESINQWKVKLEFKVTLPSGSPQIQIERAAFAVG